MPIFVFQGASPSENKNTGGAVFAALTIAILSVYTMHCTWVTSEAYSSPSIVLSARAHDGSRIIFDDFREVFDHALFICVATFGLYMEHVLS